MNTENNVDNKTENIENNEKYNKEELSSENLKKAKKEHKLRLKEEKKRKKELEKEKKLAEKEQKRNGKNDDNKGSIFKYRKIIFLILFLVILPLIAFTIISLTYYNEAQQIVVKLGKDSATNEDIEKIYRKKSFKKITPETTTTEAGAFKDNIEINITDLAIFYESSSNANDKLDPIGYGFKLDINFEMNQKNTLYGYELGSHMEQVKMYVGTQLPKSKNNEDFKSAEIDFRQTKSEHTKKKFTIKIREKLPYRVKLAPNIKDPICYIVIRVPTKDQPKIRNWEKANPTQQITGDVIKKEKLIVYHDILYYINLNEVIPSDKVSHRNEFEYY